MKPVLTNLLLVLIVISAGCHHSVAPEQNDPADLNYANDLNQAKKWFDGKWKLIAVSASISNPALPNVQLVVNNNQITVIQDERQIDQVSFEIIQTPYYLQLKPTTQPRENNWYVRDPSLKVSRNRLFLDTGRASDLPGFSFERMK